MTTLDRPAWHDTVRLAALIAEEDSADVATSLLAEVLGRLDPATALPDGLIIEAAMLYSRLVDPVADLVPDDVAWAGYACRAARVRCGPDHVTTIAAMENLASVLYVRGRFDEANRVRQDLIQLLLDRGNIDAHLIQRMELAEQFHAAGRCDDAMRQAQAAWQDWTGRYDPASPESRWIMLQFTSMLIACHQFDEAKALRSQAQFALPSSDDPIKAGYDAFIATVPATIIHHRPVCARRRDTAAADASGREGLR
ncbi:hypothetical protein [Dactylosporangium salmoneum]|uniref:Tetratricopeptide repeat protein n=1 Tax=Dactylosporangium salmoneum TaxID=53361 RepID=A0ABP5SUD7_9ACTN